MDLVVPSLKLIDESNEACLDFNLTKQTVAKVNLLCYYEYEREFDKLYYPITPECNINII